jgi:hypothetical protein
VRFGEHPVEVIKRVARDELGVDVSVGAMGAIEYPSQYNIGLDSRVRPALRPQIAGDLPNVRAVRSA